MIIFIVIVIFFADNFTHIECPNFSTEPPLVIRSIAAFFPAWLTGEKKKKSRRRLERDKSRFNKARRLSRVHISRILGKPRVPFHLSARIPFVHYPSFHSFTTPYVLILIAFSRRIPRHFSPSPSALSSFSHLSWQSFWSSNAFLVF